MERLDVKNLAAILGIDAPWTIKSFNLDSTKNIIEVQLSVNEKKSIFGFRDSAKANSETVPGSWSYMPVGGYKSVIQASVPAALAQSDSRLSRPVLSQPAFLGSPSSSYSNFIRQKVALAQLKGLDSAFICDLLKITPEQISEINNDLSKTSPQVRYLASLPTESDTVWLDVISEKVGFESDVLPLKFLLSKLRRNEINVREQVLELRKFFVENASILEKEIDQVCGIKTEKQKASVNSNKQRLILPPLKNSVWLDLLSGKVKLNSTSVPLNLLISRQRSAFIAGKTKQEKVQAIDTLRAYFRKNYRTLKRELIYLNRVMQVKGNSKLALPNSDHVIWQKILLNHDFLPSENMAYKLLLSKLKSQISLDSDPVVKLEAANKVRDFLRQNQKTMQKELSVLVKQTATL